MAIKYTPEDLNDHDATSVIIKDDKGRILMQDHIKYDFWTIPAGKVRPGQTIIEGVKEEVFEETNLKVIECKELVSKVYDYDRNGTVVKVNAHIFEILRSEGELKNMEPHKHREQRFMTIEEIAKLPHVSDTTCLYLQTLGIERTNKL
jgi:ADP-ribose pyrophosphatase YjhB (NUDIX family)